MRRSVFHRACNSGVLRLLLGAFLVGAGSMGTPAHAGTAHPSNESIAVPAEYAAVVAKLKEDAPDFVVERIRPSPIAGVLEVVSGRQILYVDVSGNYVIGGHIFDMKTKSDVTAKRLAELARVDPKQLPLEDAFTEVRGNGQRQMYVFSDPDCPFCKKLEKELPKLDNVTIHVFLYPLVSIHPNAYTNAIAVWCSSNRLKVWQDKMLKDIVPPARSCANPVDRNLALGEKLGITGTPTMIFQDGTVVAGAVSAERIAALLSPAK